MRVGILTYHRSLNHGAYLQAYGTLKTLLAMGHDVEIINYCNQKHWYMDMVKPWFAYRRPVRFLDRIKKGKAFRRDWALMKSTPFTKDPDRVKSWHYDAIIVGSDTVWNFKQFGVDPLYFGGANADHMVAYAPSFGTVKYGDVLPVEVENGIRSFDTLCARDSYTKQIVDGITGQDVPLVLDPAFLLDWEQLEVTPRPLKQPFIMVYGSAYADSDANFIIKLAKERGWKIVSFGNIRNRWAEYSPMEVGPLDSMRYFKHAEFVVSSTFHGCVFAICCRKNFFARLSLGSQEKVQALLGMFGLQDRASFELGNLVDEAVHDIEYANIWPMLEKHVQASKAYLKQALDN